MCAWQVLHGLGVLDDLLHHQEPARAITFASPSFRTLFSVPDSIVCFGPLTSSFILFDMSLTSICHMPAIQVWLVSSIKLSGYQAINYLMCYLVQQSPGSRQRCPLLSMTHL